MLKGKGKFFLLLVLVLVAMPAIRGFLLTWKVIDPGYTGIKINRLVNRGVTREDIVTGFIFYNPIQSAVVVYPTFIQRVAWTQDVHEGSARNEQLTFNTKDSVPVDIDVAVSYQLDSAKVPDFYTKFRADNIDTFTHGFLRDTTRNIVAQIGSEYTFDDVNGSRKEEFLAKVGKVLGENIRPYGVLVQQFGLIGSLRPPKSLLDAVNSKTQAIQKSIQVENEVRQAEAEAKKKIAIANGEAAANRALASSLDPKLLEWEKLQIMRLQISKWDGKMPGVYAGGSGQGLLLNIPSPGSAGGR
ncbi:MAG: prohibitin family protein [Desulfuromonadales bacterium]|nr:prohibitin family protein [Desulfuromonadales bacterium]